jgi:hypothetical protein
MATGYTAGGRVLNGRGDSGRGESSVAQDSYNLTPNPFPSGKGNRIFGMG